LCPFALVALLLYRSLVIAEDKPDVQENSSTPIQALERRVQELEGTIRAMQAGAAGTRVFANPSQLGGAAHKSATPTIRQPSPLQVPPEPDVLPEPTLDPSAPATPENITDSKAGFPEKNERAIVAGWDNGFFLRSVDKWFYLRITGQIQADYRTFLDDVDSTDIDTFFLRRARFGIEADLLGAYEFRFLPDFGQGQARIQDAYINVHYWDAFQVEAGKFKQPFSYEQLIQDRYVPTLERSLIDQLVPARDEGIMIHGGKLFSGRLDWAFSVSNGEINGDTDTNDLKDLAGRVAVRPFGCSPCGSLLRGLQLGIAGTTGVEEEQAMPQTLKTPAGVPWFQFNSSVRADGRRDRWSPEIVYFYGPLGVAAQYFEQVQRFRPTATSAIDEKIPFDGFYVLLTYLLTGEERSTYSEQIRPRRDYNPWYPFACPGAWEAVARVSRLDVGDQVFASGSRRLADPTRYSDGATELTAGFNWYLNAWVRTQFNWEHAWFDERVRLGPGPQGLLSHQDTLMMRFQIIF
jgi:phosphate-selective porin OprO/OprP